MNYYFVFNYSSGGIFFYFYVQLFLFSLNSHSAATLKGVFIDARQRARFKITRG